MTEQEYKLNKSVFEYRNKRLRKLYDEMCRAYEEHGQYSQAYQYAKDDYDTLDCRQEILASQIRCFER